MNVVGIVLWSAVTLLAVVGIASAVLALRRSRPLLALPALAPAGLGVLLVASGLPLGAGVPVLAVVLSLALAALAVLAGGPFTRAVLERTAPSEEREGEHGGILVRGDDAVDGPPREVMRGGSVIGLLERAAVVGAFAVGRPEVLIAVIAIKGLGRFTELDTSEARERFIIGTLVSLIWASVCGAVIWLLRT